MPCCSRGGCSLYYEFYIDQFFLEQVITQGFLLLLASKTAGKHLTCRRLGAGSPDRCWDDDTFSLRRKPGAGIFWFADGGKRSACRKKMAGDTTGSGDTSVCDTLLWRRGTGSCGTDGCSGCGGELRCIFSSAFCREKTEGTQALPEAGSGSKNYMGERKHNGKRNRRYGKQSAGTAWQKSGQHPGSGSGREASAGRMGDAQRVLPDSVSFDRAEKRMDACISGG